MTENKQETTVGNREVEFGEKITFALLFFCLGAEWRAPVK